MISQVLDWRFYIQVVFQYFLIPALRSKNQQVNHRQ